MNSSQTGNLEKVPDQQQPIKDEKENLYVLISKQWSTKLKFVVVQT